MANDTPVTRMAGQIVIIPRQPANAQISQNGTINEKNGNWRPTIAPRLQGSSPVTDARPWIGVPSAPHAPGAVSPSSDTPAAASGAQPSPSTSATASRDGG